MALRSTLTPRDPTVETSSLADTSPVISGTRDIQSSLGSRLGQLRSERGSRLKTAVQPRLQETAMRRGATERATVNEGSRQFQERADVGLTEELANQQIEAQELGSLLQTEQGIEQVQQQFTAMFNQMANERFTRELSGLGEEVDKFMAEQGAGVNADRIAANARGASMDILGRFTQAAAMEFGRDSDFDPSFGSSSFDVSRTDPSFRG